MKIILPQLRGIALSWAVATIEKLPVGIYTMADARERLIRCGELATWERIPGGLASLEKQYPKLCWLDDDGHKNSTPSLVAKVAFAENWNTWAAVAEREKIGSHPHFDVWVGTKLRGLEAPLQVEGRTKLEAEARSWVAFNWGESFEVPDELAPVIG